MESLPVMAMEEEASWVIVLAGRTLRTMLTGFRLSHQVGTGRLSWCLLRANSLMNKFRHDTLTQTLESEAFQLATEDSHSVASFAKSAGQAQTWMAD
jgi:hypothetical protein